ncbi:GNAT family N-acetyltransferase [Kitasatospora sp. LaBMicrA B282]|uniref:GNAT family N-acetyltransferase n=1 Tax=Kitasatospora sp. LaBMicrA B282 TaxID=3420949 RepID=UPI003D145B21
MESIADGLGRTVDGYTWTYRIEDVDLDELSHLYRVAPLGDKPPAELATVFGNSMFTCFVHADGALVGAGRALADGVDCAYIGHVAVHPDHQGRGLGSAVMRRLVELAQGHKKIILYASPGAEAFYERLGFLRMKTAMGIWSDPDRAVGIGLLDRGDRPGD